MTDTQSTGPRPAPSLPSGLSQAQYCLLLSPTASSKSERITLSTWRTSRIGRVRRKRKKQKITPIARRMKSRESKASVFRATARVASRPTARFVSQTSPVSLHTTGDQLRTSVFQILCLFCITHELRTSGSCRQTYLTPRQCHR